MTPAIAALLAAMVVVESGGDASKVGDNGRSIGPLQIQRAYWQDSGVPGAYEDCRDLSYAKRVVVAYWRRYCPRALEAGDLQTLARVHNGGPKGAKKQATLAYWRKVKAQMERVAK